MRDFRLLRQTISILVLCILIEFCSGSVLEGIKEKFSLIPGLLLMVPPLIDLRGNIGSALGSRLGTGLHLGLIAPELRLTRTLKLNILLSLTLSCVASATIGIFAYVLGEIMHLEGVSVFSLLFIAVFSGALSGVLITLLTILLAIISFKKNWDPDIVTGPVITTLGDIVTVLMIWLAVILW